MKPITQAADADTGIQYSLSTKISVIVFWGMIVTGIVVSFFLLHGLEKDITAKHYTHVHGFLAELERANQEENLSWTGLAQLAEEKRQFYNFHGAVFVRDKDEIRVGDQAVPLFPLTAQFVLQEGQGHARLARTVTATMFFAPLEEMVAQKRKHILMFMGAILLVFGLLLHWILQKVLTQPFNKMVQIAVAITQGDDALRFEEKRTDEFGFLAKFINQALDFVELKKKQLQLALDDSQSDLLAEKRRIAVTLHSIGDAVIATDTAGNIEYLNSAAEQLITRRLNEVRGQAISSILQLIDEDTRMPVENSIEACLRQGITIGPVEHLVLVRLDGSEMDVVNTAAPIREEGGPLIGAVLVFHDVSKARKLAKQLTYQATHDDLTGLFNRREFESCLEKAMKTVETGKHEHALCYMDLDQFKIVNDTCGHVAGDELLRQVTLILNEKIRNSDTVARLGGDEFGILLKGCHAVAARRIGEGLLEHLKNFRFVWQEHAFDIGASIGLVAITSNNQSPSEVLSAADIACYAAKEGGRNRLHEYRPDDAALTQRHGEMRWVSRLVKALEEDRFRLYCQSIVPVSKKESAPPHYELLIRLLDEEGKIVPPLAFIPAAERYNLMSSIDRWVIRKAFKTFSENSALCSSWLFSINLSGASLCDQGFLGFVIDELDKSGVSPQQVCFEITETTAIANLTVAMQFISILQGMGCHFSLDDFGTGLSSFRYLQVLKVNYLKIDGSFVRNMVNDPVNRSVVESANQIGHAMGIKTVAEFVENDEILDALREIGVDYAQGYGVHKPQSLDEVLKKLEPLMLLHVFKK